MTEIQEKAIQAVSALQPTEKTAVWMVGEQLKDIVRNEPACAEILLEDLQSETMSLAKAEEKIEERARKNNKGRCGIVTPAEADEILRKFYGLPDKVANPFEDREPLIAPKNDGIIDIFDYLNG